MRAVQRTVVHPLHAGFRILTHPLVISGVVIPRGFVWDGCSIPSAFQWLIGHPFDGPLADGGLVHDYLYETHKATREVADAILYKELVSDGAGEARARAMWSAVRLFAASHYSDPSPWEKFVPEAQLEVWEGRKAA